MIAIHKSTFGFHPRWIAYCEKRGIAYKLVNCYANDLIEQLKNCKALMWHFNHGNHRDNLIARQILFALEHTGFQVFPDFRTAWHFDDKVAQKYLFEAIDAPLVPSYAYFSKKEALDWANQATFPKVFKLRNGAGSQNVRLIHTRAQAIQIIKKAFSSGFPKYDSWGSLRDRLYKFRRGKASIVEVLKGMARLIYAPAYARMGSREVGYVYFQDFVPQNDSDIRIIVIGGKAFGLKRFVREGDFRASGSGSFAYSRDLFDIRCVQIAFDTVRRLKLQVGVFDFVFDSENNPLIVEVSYGYAHAAYDHCPGYWDTQLDWHEGKTVKEEWMVELMLTCLEVEFH
ncbi:RimK family alpha-L-glutamate ligase [Cyclobacterium xiamenense]|uniref:ATP-grasp domain-containing protein n=1 Tax=Cyclobacterium xiamenense TaxID=1297121 RepID=UPI0035CEC8FA